MKNWIRDFLIGIVIGIANIIPGLSGGTIAVVFRVYNRLISSLKNLFKTPVHSLKAISGLLLGIVGGVVFSVFVIIKLIALLPLPTSLLFVGLILGSIPDIYQQAKEEKKSWFNYLVFLVLFALLIVLPQLPNKELDMDITVFTVIAMFLIGVIAASTMIIPGVSGSMVLMVLGVYFIILGYTNTFIQSLVQFDFAALLPTLFFLVPFGLGIVVGIVVISKLISKLFVSNKAVFYWGILGLLLASPFAVLYGIITEYQTVITNQLLLNILLGILFLGIGTALSVYMNYLGKKHEQVQNI